MRSVVDRHRNDTISKIVSVASNTVDSVYQRSWRQSGRGVIASNVACA